MTNTLHNPPAAAERAATHPATVDHPRAQPTRAGRGLVSLLVAALAGTAAELTAIALTATAAWLITRAAQQPPLSALAVAIVLVRALAIGRGVFRYLERLTGHDAVLRVMARLRGRFFAALARRGRIELTGSRRADLLSGMVGDVDAVQDLLLRTALPMVSALLVGAAVCAWLATLLPTAAFALAGGLLLAGLGLPSLAAVLLDRTDRRLAAARSDLADRTVDLVEGIEDLALNGAVGAALDRERAASDALAVLRRRRARHAAAIVAAATLMQLGTCALIGVLAVGAESAGRLDPVTLAVVVLASLAAVEITVPLVAAGERAGTVLGALRRLRTVINTPPAPRAQMGIPEPVSVRLTDVTVWHPGARHPALDPVNLTVPAGARVAVIGPTGAGKSTLLSVILGLIAPTTGSATLSGHEIADIPSENLHPRLVSGLTQDAYLFAGSIRSNLLLARPDASEARLWSVLARVGAADWVRGLDLGLDTVIGRDSALLAGGQRQRVALATALLADPAVLVLDEPAESLDADTERVVFDDIVRATTGRTAIVATHHIADLSRFDTIVVLVDGRIEQHGTHDELLRVDGYYRDHCPYLAESDFPSTHNRYAGRIVGSRGRG